MAFELVTSIFKLIAVEQNSITEECIDLICVRQDITTWTRFSVLPRVLI